MPISFACCRRAPRSIVWGQDGARPSASVCRGAGAPSVESQTNDSKDAPPSRPKEQGHRLRCRRRRPLHPKLCRSMLGAELRLGNAGAHDARGGGAAGDDVPGLVDDLRAAPLLVRQCLHTELALLALDELHIRRHPALRVVSGEEVDAKRITMEAGQGDKLPTEAQLREIPNEALHLLVLHARGVPIEGRAEVVGQHLVRHRAPHLPGELLGLRKDRFSRLHPHRVCVRREGDGALNAELGGALDAKVPLHRASDIPIEEDIAGTQRGRGFAHLLQGHLQGVL
mmetsp:Transcript_92592/g.267361  ORF Transcript_92592/g.267361 Transcript_92592/m.267361 type:complete len:284 (+) Transcript_92592:66-917(+)